MESSQEIKEQILSRIDIVELISEYIPLKKAGVNFKGLCPFHNEKTPSFVVSAEKQIFHCFGCQAGGDIFSFVMKHDNLTFPEALRLFADKCGVAMPEKSYAATQERNKSHSIKEINRVASDYYHHCLMNNSDAAHARKYLILRNYNDDVIKQCQLGYAGIGGRNLLDYLLKKGFAQQMLAESGLFSVNQGGGLTDLFKGRLMFPICNARDEVIAFGGRVLNDGLPKYLNSPETPIFRKREELYGLNNAKRAISQADSVLVVEGYFDQIRLFEKGFCNVVATLGTALTSAHARTIRRYTKNIKVLFDSDAAGIAAALRGVEVVVSEGLNVQVLTLPGSKDPDEFLCEHTPEAFASLLERSCKDFFDFKFDLLLKKYNKDVVSELASIVSEMLDLIGMVDNQVMVDKYMQKLARKVNVSEHALQAELKKKAGKSSARTVVKKPEVVPVPQAAKTEYPDEQALVSVLASAPYLWAQVKKLGVETGDFQDVYAREIVPVLDAYDSASDEGDFNSVLYAAVSEETKTFLSRVLLKTEEIDNEVRFVNDRVREIKVRQKKDMCRQLEQELRSVSAADRDAKLLQFTVLKKELSDLRAQKGNPFA